MIVHGVQPDELGLVFPKIAWLLKKIPALEDRYGTDAVYEMIETGKWQLWVMGEGSPIGVLLTTVIRYPRRKELHLLGVAGVRMKEWIHLFPRIEEFAVRRGCERISLMGVRRGFRKLLPGFTGNRIVLEKKL